MIVKQKFQEWSPIQSISVGAPLNFENPMEVPDWQDWFSPMWLEEHEGEKIGHGYRQFRAGGENAGAIRSIFTSQSSAHFWFTLRVRLTSG